ncbi:hypothetical protein HPP92_010183 [Vanilla planifolia]|uniref:Oxysterol-binding protein n=1 Tax=Vanilla planifolia TaxID=51239 RepID=A0A835R4N5_VANPL|nr:hypothetical protein HPP92_010183 [Vanilla planifolia]
MASEHAILPTATSSISLYKTHKSYRSLLPALAKSWRKQVEGFVILASLCYKNVKQVGEETTKEATLTPPFSLENGLLAEHRPPNLLHRIFSLFSNVRPGADLTNFELPPLFNMPKSQLQCYGETVYCIGEDLLTRCARGKSSLERFIAVVAWNISTTRPVIFGWAPFNPVLGETHHVSRGNLNVLLEQVSHHPPVSALHATDEVEKLELVWCHCPAPKFHGKSIKAAIKGKRHLRLLSHGENYEMNAPDLFF